MPKLVRKTETKVTHTSIEDWSLSNNLKVSIELGDKFSCVMFNNDTGDVTEQIYDNCGVKQNFPNVKLASLTCYYLKVDPSEVQNLLLFAEKIDPAQLKAGRSY